MIGDDDRVVIGEPFPAQKLQLLCGCFVSCHPFENSNPPQGYPHAQDSRDFSRNDPSVYILASPQHSNLLLHPRLQGDYQIEFNPALDQTFRGLQPEKLLGARKRIFFRCPGRLPRRPLLLAKKRNRMGIKIQAQIPGELKPFTNFASAEKNSQN